MAIGAEFRFVTATAELRVGASHNGMGDHKIAIMDVDHSTTETTQFVGRANLVTAQAKLLLVAGGTVRYSGLGLAPVIQGPGRAVRLGGDKSNFGREARSVALQTNLLVRHNAGRSGLMAGLAGNLDNMLLEMLSVREKYFT